MPEISLATVVHIKVRGRLNDGMWWVRYRGTREALIAARLAEPEWFPVGRKRTSCSNAFRPIGYFWDMHYVKGGMWEIYRDRVPGGELERVRTMAVMNARQDAAFHRFMGRLLPNQPGAH